MKLYLLEGVYLVSAVGLDPESVQNIQSYQLYLNIANGEIIREPVLEYSNVTVTVP